ncbi:MAG: HAD-IA family hydrolase [Alphaproteobacteria bacterium]
MRPEIEAVLWDFGGVITTSPFEAFNRYEAEHGLPRDFIRMVNAANPDGNAWARFERSEISLEEFDRLFAEESGAQGHEVPGADVIELLHGDIRPEMVRALAFCGNHFKTGCITNNVLPKEGEDFWRYGRHADRAAQIARIMSLFDHVIESSKVGMRKPDPRIYEMMCRALSVEPSGCVYLDDLGINLKPARAMGMTTIKVVDPAAALGELEEATGLRFG